MTFIPEEYLVMIKYLSDTIITWARPQGWPESPMSVSELNIE